MRSRQLGVSWASRSEEPNGKTSPEELIAAAWASCFSMALSAGLAKGGTPPERLETSATVTFQPGEGITKGALTVRGTVPGLDADAFSEAAETREGELPGLEGAGGHPRNVRSTRRSHRHTAAVAALDDLIAELDRSYEEAQARLSDPAVYNDHREAADVGRRLKELEGPYKLAQQWKQASDDLEAARARLRSSRRWPTATRPTSCGSRRS